MENSIFNFYRKLVWNTEHQNQTINDRIKVVDIILKNNPELVIKSRPDSSLHNLPFKDGCLSRNVYWRVLDYYNDWIFNGVKDEKKKSTKSKSYYNSETDYKKSKINCKKSKISQKHFNESNNSEVQNLNNRIIHNKIMIKKLQNGKKNKETNRRLLCNDQYFLKIDRQEIYDNSLHFKDIPSNNDEGLNINIINFDISLSDPDTIKYIMALNKNFLIKHGLYDLIDLRIELDSIIKNCVFDKYEDLIIKFKSYGYSEAYIANNILNISRTTLRRRYKSAINKIAARSGYFMTANMNINKARKLHK